MTKIDIFSGFLGAGKTTLIKKLIQDAYKGEKLVLIENEFGEIGIDGGFLEDAGIEITEMNSGCICCSLVGDFSKALKKVLSDFAPDRIIIEPSGVGKLSDIIKAVRSVDADMELNSFTTVADVNRCKMYVDNFGEFYKDQIEYANCIILSHTQTSSDEKIKICVDLLREMNKTATIITTPWDKLTGAQIIEAMEKKDTLSKDLESLKTEAEHHHHDHECCGHHEHHEHHDHDHECCEHHEHHDHECCGHHEHHDHECCGHHEHDHECCGHHEHDHECCGHHDHHEHHHHHADEVFTSWGRETTNKYSESEMKEILSKLKDSDEYGMVLRAKGIVEGDNGEWIHFDYVPDGIDVRFGKANVIGRVCVIGSGIDEEKIAKLFKI